MRQSRYHRTVLPGSVLRRTAVLLTALAAITCGASDDAAPVARVEVAIDRGRVPAGAPAAFTYRFTPLADIDGDYLVFVHLVNVDGQLLWDDDHEPPTPTSAWRAGERVEYTREVFLPASLRPGDVTIEVGLYRGDERLPLEASRRPRSASTRAYPVVDLQVAPDTDNVYLTFPEGWYEEEREGSRSWRWTRRSASLLFRHPRRDVVLWVECAGHPGASADAPQQLRVAGPDGAELAAFTVDSTVPVRQRIPLQAQQLGSDEMVELRLEVDRTFVPADEGLGQDRRELGVRVFHVFVDAR